MVMTNSRIVFDIFQVWFLEMCHKIMIENRSVHKPKWIVLVSVWNMVDDKSSHVDFNAAEKWQKDVSQIMVKIVQVYRIIKGCSFFENMWTSSSFLRSSTCSSIVVACFIINWVWKKRDTPKSIPVILIIVQVNSLCIPALNYGYKNTIIISIKTNLWKFF